MTLLKVNNLSVSFKNRDGIIHAVKDVSFNIDSGQILGIVGESGSGKSVCCYSIMGLVENNKLSSKSGSIQFEGNELLNADEKYMRSIRGKKISMIFQDPMTALNPYLTIGQQIIEPLILHHNIEKLEAKQKALTLLEEVGITDVESRYNQYPHQFSGGMRQRVVIAMALITEPELLIADEPTTALDVTIQKQILNLIKDIQIKRNIAIIFISHDLSVIKEITNTAIVMRDGLIIEKNKTSNLFNHPKEEYTKKLISSIPTGKKPSEYIYQQELENKVIEIKKLDLKYENKGKNFQALKNINLSICKGEILGLVGESGCGKTSLSHSIVKLININSGEIKINKKSIHKQKNRDLLHTRKSIQMIFQDPFASLNPRMTIFNILAEPIKLHNLYVDNKNLKEKIFKLMEDVGIDKSWINKYPHEFSGGQRQRIAIARALAAEPEIIIADEPVSALDVTIQSQILDLLLTICKRNQLTMIFISHDLSVIRYMADRTAVMNNGRIVEINDTEKIYFKPQHSYTKKLISAMI